MRRSTIAILAALAAVPLLGAFVLSRPEAQEAPDRAATEQIVREYLLENPEVIIEALDRWRNQQDLMAATQAEGAALEALPVLFSGETGFAMGASQGEAKVLVAEFFDYHCGFCRRATDFVMGLTEEDDIRVVFQDLPILRDESRGAALAGLAAARTGDYPEMHRQIMRTGGVLTEDAIAKAAKRAGATDALDALDDESVRMELEAKLSSSLRIAEAMGLSGTPTFVIASPDGAIIRVVPAFAPEQVEAAIEEVRAL